MPTVRYFPPDDYSLDSVVFSDRVRNFLGSFWNIIFDEKSTIQGYAAGLAEELFQTYVSLAESIKSFSVEDCPVFQTVKWYPLILKKSELEKTKLIYRAEDAIHGPQKETNFYGNAVFRFGFPKDQNEKFYSYKLSQNFSGCSLFSNKVLFPSFAAVKGVDFVISDGKIFFNFNPFDSGYFRSLDVFSETGELLFFTDETGRLVKDEMIILWCYNGEIDSKNLYKSFGYIFNFSLPGDEKYKNILISLIKLVSGGGTTGGFKSVLAACADQPIVQHQFEIVEDIYARNKERYVITDKQVYKTSADDNLMPYVFVGATLKKNQFLTDVVQYYDNLVSPDWYTSSAFPQLIFSKNMFNGVVNNAIGFKNGFELLTRKNNGEYVFPVIGTPEDVASFNKLINDNGIHDYFNLTAGSSLAINPMTFIFDNFLKQGTAAFVFNIRTHLYDLKIPDFLVLIKEYLPPHVYAINYITISAETENYENLNFSTGVNADGSSAVTYDIAAPYNDIKTTLFSIAFSPKDLVGLSVEGNTLKTGLNATAGFIDGDSFSLPSDYGIPAGATTQTFNNLKLMSF